MNTGMHVTLRAVEHLREVLASRAEGADLCLRLVAGPAGAGILIDRCRKEDRVVEIGGMPILHLHPLLEPFLRGATLDYVECPEGPTLTLVRGRNSSPEAA